MRAHGISFRKLATIALISATLLVRCEAAEPGEALVTVEVERNTVKRILPGLVVHSADDQSYVVLHQRHDERFPSFGEPAFTVLWGTPPRRVAATLIEDKRDRAKWLLRAPANALPAPPQLTDQAPAKSLQKLKIVGVNVDAQGKSQVIKAEATVDRIFQYSLDEVAFYELRHQGEKNIHMGLALALDGKVIAYRGPWIGFPDEPQPWFPLEQLRKWVKEKTE